MFSKNEFWNLLQQDSRVFLCSMIIDTMLWKSFFENKKYSAGSIIKFYRIEPNFDLPVTLCTQSAVTGSKLIIETLEQGVKYVQSQQ